MTSTKYSGLDVLTQVPGVTSSDVHTWLDKARLLLPEEQTYKDICHYVENGQVHNFRMEVMNIVRIVKKNDLTLGQLNPRLRGKRRPRMLLWHGSPVASVPSIIEHGFQLPQDNGQMFGTGLYFADRASKSANYAARVRGSPDIESGEIGYMFLCDVFVGTMYNAKNAKLHVNGPPTIPRNGEEVVCDSLKCSGEFIPDKTEAKFFRTSSGSQFIIPYGKTIRNPNYEEFTVTYNEFVVYRLDRCKPNHLVQFRFVPKPDGN